MTDRKREDFITIRNRVMHLADTHEARAHASIAHYLKFLGRPLLESFATREIQVARLDVRVIGIADDAIPGGYVFHSAREPARQTGSTRHYFLFDLMFSQGEWFDILDYTPEEQLMHVLKWGRQ